MIKIPGLLRNKKVRGLLELGLVLFLWWFFYSPGAPGIYVLNFIALIFWRDPLIEAITGWKVLDFIIFGLRVGQMIYYALAAAYFIAVFAMLVVVTRQAVKNFLSKE